MSRKFNLFLLHSTNDAHPRSWICIKGFGLKNIIKDLEKNVLKTYGYCRESLSEKLSIRFHCSRGVIKRILQGKSEFFPIPLVLELLKLSKNRRKFLKKIKQNIQYLKVNSASAKPVKAVYKLNEDLAKILGAFMADGSLSIQIVLASSNLNDLERAKSKLTGLKIYYSTGVALSRNQNYISIQANKDNFKLLNKFIPSLHLLNQTHYSIELTDEYKDNVEAFIKWTKEEFNIDPNSFEKKGNAWRVTFSNKILARHLMIFFDVRPGPKCYSAFEPMIIKKSNLKIRKAFAKGVLMFDGCVSKQNKILFGTVSRLLYNSIKQIWKKDRIKFGKSIDRRKSGFCNKRGIEIFNTFTTAENKKEKLLKYFEPNTQKWKLIHWLSGDLSCVPIIKNNHSLSLKKVLEILQKIKVCDAIFLKNYFNCAYTTIRDHLKILKNQGKIKLSDHPNYINDYISKNATVLLKNRTHKLLFGRIREKFRKDKNFAKFLGIHKATISAWRLRKNRIPISILKNMCKILDFNFNKVSKNIEKTDREISEII